LGSDVFDYDKVEECPEAVAAVAEYIQQAGIPAAPSDEDRERRLAEHQAREARHKERRAQDKARREFEEQREQERRQQAARVEHQREMRERSAQRDRERQAEQDRERLAAVEHRHQAEQARQQQAAREQALRQYWGEVDGLLTGLDRLCNPPPPDHTAARIAELEGELEAEAAARAADAERARSAKFYSDQRAAVAKREASGGW
jgi:colicin import membrane protein